MKKPSLIAACVASAFVVGCGNEPTAPVTPTDTAAPAPVAPNGNAKSANPEASKTATKLLN